MLKIYKFFKGPEVLKYAARENKPWPSQLNMLGTSIFILP